MVRKPWELKMENEIHVSRGGTCFSGPKAVDLFRIHVLRSAIGLMAKGIKPMRGASMTKLLVMATEYTGKEYKRREHEAAVADLQALAAERKQEIPVRHT